MTDPRERIENLTPELFLSGPGDFMIRRICELLLAEPHWAKIFGPNIDAYKRMDYGIRNLPALRIYNNRWRRDAESWFITGDLTMDIIFPASTRRDELQRFQDVLTSALTQQFRRPQFFQAVAAEVPGLNELGRTMDADKSLGFEWGEDMVPLTQIATNFRIDLREWDQFLESDDRTKDDPFDRTLGDLQTINGLIQAFRDDMESELELGTDTVLEGDN